MADEKNILTVIDKEQLLESVMVMKTRGLRLSQACASYKDGKYNLSYSFAEDDNYRYETLRVVIDKDDMITPHSVVSGLCPLMRFRIIPASKPTDKR